jgi:hypothetical protein
MKVNTRFSSHFQFKNEFLIKEDYVSIGTPPTPLFSNIFMSDLLTNAKT